MLNCCPRAMAAMEPCQDFQLRDRPALDGLAIGDIHMAMLEILSCQKFQDSVSNFFQAQFCRKSQHLQPYGSLWFITNVQLKLHFGVSPSHCFRLAGSPKTTHCARLLCQVSVLRLPRRPGGFFGRGEHPMAALCFVLVSMVEKLLHTSMYNIYIYIYIVYTHIHTYTHAFLHIWSYMYTLYTHISIYIYIYTHVSRV